MDQKKPRHFTVMIMPETSGMEVKRLRVSRRLIVSSVVGVACVVLLAGAAMVHSAFMLGEAEENAALRTENSELRSEIEGLDDRLTSIDRTVERMKHFDAKLRALTMVSDPERNLAIGPVGALEEPESGPAAQAAADLRQDLLGHSPNRALTVMENGLEVAEADAGATLDQIRDLSVFLSDQQAVLASTPSRRPTHGYVTSTFGMRMDPFTGLPQRHAGIDFSASIGAPVVATADGVVIYAGNKGAYGKTIEIDHGHGLVTKFAHLSKIDTRIGEKVKRGQTVGAVGNTGRSTGPHLHYEIRLNGIAQDPQRYLLE